MIKKFLKGYAARNVNAGGTPALPANNVGGMCAFSWNTAGETPALPAQGAIWQEEYWDRFIRDEKHFNSALRYILENPLKAGLVDTVENWPWSFAVGMKS